MRVIFEGQLNRESAQEFCDAVILSVNEMDESDTLHIYFSTEGGFHHSIYPIIDTILEYKDKIKLYLDNVMYSGGFLMLMYLKEIEIKLKPSFRNAMMHTLSCEINTADDRKREDEKELKTKNKQVYKTLKTLGFTDKELKKFKNQIDVYISKDRVLELFPNITEEEYEL